MQRMAVIVHRAAGGGMSVPLCGGAYLLYKPHYRKKKVARVSSFSKKELPLQQISMKHL
jgi:hypothetical protein